MAGETVTPERLKYEGVKRHRGILVSVGIPRVFHYADNTYSKKVRVCMTVVENERLNVRSTRGTKFPIPVIADPAQAGPTLRGRTPKVDRAKNKTPCLRSED